MPVSSSKMDITHLCISRGALYFPVGRRGCCLHTFLVYIPRQNGNKSCAVEIAMMFPEKSLSLLLNGVLCKSKNISDTFTK